MITYGGCIGSQERWDRYVGPVIRDRSRVELRYQRSIAEAYNRILTHRSKNPGGIEALILLHDDLEVLDRADAEAKVRSAFADPDVALVGVAGGMARTGLAWWNADPVGHQYTDSGLIDFGRRSGDVDLIEGSFMAFSPWAISYLRFDMAYPGFHGYDEIAMQARNLGKRVVVVDVDTHHHTTVGFDSEDDAAVWARANDRFRQKWLS